MCGKVASKPRPILITDSNNITLYVPGSFHCKTNTTTSKRTLWDSQIFVAGPHNDDKFLLCWVLKVVLERSLTVH